MADQPVPRLLGLDGHRLLLADLPGEDGFEADETDQRAMVDVLVDLQLAAVDRMDQRIAAGVPDLRGDRLSETLRTLVHRVAPDRGPLVDLVEALPERMAAVTNTGIPDTIVHGDPHGGNCRRGVDPPIWFDWGDSTIGNPLLDLGVTHRMSASTVDHWVDRWRQAVPGADPQAAWQLLAPVAALLEAWVYQRFLDNIEPDEHCYHRREVPAALDRTEAMLTRPQDR